MKWHSGDCHWTSLKRNQHWFRYWLGAWWHQAITWANVDPNLCCHMASLGHNELISVTAGLLASHGKLRAVMMPTSSSLVASEVVWELWWCQLRHLWLYQKLSLWQLNIAGNHNKFVTLPTLSSQATQEAVTLTTSCAASDKSFQGSSLMG